jgi:predicted metal-binding protein
MEIDEFAEKIGVEIAGRFEPEMIIPEERIRAFCRENKCGNFGRNYMCPPSVGSIEEISFKLKSYRSGILVRYTRAIDVHRDRERVFKTQIDFHHKIIQIEEFLKAQGQTRVWGLVGGNCRLCPVCGAVTGEPCLLPGQARMSLEAIGIDVLGLLAKLGLDNRFYADKIIWTGCILVGK